MNNNLFNLNKKTLNEKEQKKAETSVIINELKKSGKDNNYELAVILNVLAENLSILKDTDNKKELVELLETRKQIKQSVKGE